jgi:hypothetical protein
LWMIECFGVSFAALRMTAKTNNAKN